MPPAVAECAGFEEACRGLPNIPATKATNPIAPEPFPATSPGLTYVYAIIGPPTGATSSNQALAQSSWRRPSAAAPQDVKKPDTRTSPVPRPGAEHPPC